MQKLTETGQIKVGASIELGYGNLNGKHHTVEEVLNAGTDREEIILMIEGNMYFITSMAIDGTSWAKDVKFSNEKRNND